MNDVTQVHLSPDLTDKLTGVKDRLSVSKQVKIVLYKKETKYTNS